MRYLVLTLLFWSIWPTVLLSLTKAECDEIKQKYGVVSPACDVNPQESVNRTESSGSNAVPLSDLLERRTPDGLRADQLENNIFFPAGGADLDESAIYQVAAVGRVLRTSLLKDTCVQLIGHSDASGAETGNLKVGLLRAQSVAAKLGAEIGDQRIESLISQGEWALLPNLTDRHAFQRRVEIRVRKCPVVN